MSQDLEKIRHYKGTVADFKNFFDQKAAETAKETDEKMNTNAFGTPEYQGFNDVHPTRGANASPHWEESNLQEKDDDNPFKKGDSIIVDQIFGPETKRFKGKKGIVNSTQGTYVSVKLKGFSSSDIEFHKGELKLDEAVNEDKEVTQEMWDKEWKIRKTFGKEYEEHFAKRIEAAMSKAKNEDMAENWAFINWKQLPGKADGMTIKESLNEAVGLTTLAAATIGAGILIRLGLMSDAKLKKTIDAAKETGKEAGKALKMAGNALARDLPIIGKKIKNKELTAWQLEELQKYLKHEITDKDVIESMSQNPELKKIIDEIAAGSKSYYHFYEHIRRIKGNPWATLDKKFTTLRKKLMKGELEESNSTSTKVDRLPLFEDFQG